MTDAMLGFDTSVHKTARQAVQAVKDFCYDTASGQQRALVLWGGYGAGKTHLAQRAAAYLASVTYYDELGTTQHRRVKFLRSVDFFGDIKDAYSANAPLGNLFAAWTGGDLFIDDIGKEHVRAESLGWAQEQLYRVVDKLQQRGKSLMITSNLPPNEIAGVLGGAAWSRVLGMCRDRNGIVDMSGWQDYRTRGFQR